MNDKNLWQTFSNGIIRENPVLRLVLGTCPTLAVTTMASNAIGMGVAVTIVLIFSNTVISLTRRFIPEKIRIPAFITIIACFVTAVQFLVKAFAPEIDRSLGIYLPLTTVNCIILARAETHASKNSALSSALDGFGMGIGFTAVLLIMGIIRELAGAGTLFGYAVTAGHIAPTLVMILPPGGFFVFGLLIAVVKKIDYKSEIPAGCTVCGACDFRMGDACDKNRGEEAKFEK